MIHQTAIVDPLARLADDVEVGAYSIIGPHVSIGAGTKIGPHVVVEGPTEIGENNRIWQFASVGADPQDKKHHGEETWLRMGDGNTIREFVTINRGTVDGGGETQIGNDNWIMAYVHIAHDCIIGNQAIFANNASLAGHVVIEDHVILGGFSLIHQFCRIGAHAFTSMGSKVNQDVPPYVTVAGKMAEPRGLNAEGLKRRGFSRERIRQIKQAYKLLYKSGLRLDEAIEAISELDASSEDLAAFTAFLQTSERSILR
jgi:UDP-N-acetylglucosamine acyltransferase